MNGPAYNYAAQKAQLTRALKGFNETKTGTARERVLAACKKAVAQWNAHGPWPDDWARWQRALDDTYDWGSAPRLEDLR